MPPGLRPASIYKRSPSAPERPRRACAGLTHDAVDSVIRAVLSQRTLLALLPQAALARIARNASVSILVWAFAGLTCNAADSVIGATRAQRALLTLPARTLLARLTCDAAISVFGWVRARLT